MSKEKTDYFKLAEATPLQKIILTISIISGIILFYVVVIPLIKYFVVTTLNGAVHSGSNELISYTLDNTKIQRRTDPLFVWAVDLYLKTPTAARFWFQPIFSMSMIAILFGVVIDILEPNISAYFILLLFCLYHLDILSKKLREK